jgi:hypothetical protein
VTYIGEMAIHSTSVRSLPVHVDVRANVRVDSDPDDTGSSAESTVDVDAVYGGPTSDAGFQESNEAHAQQSWSASPEMYFVPTTTPTNRDVPSGSVVHSSPHSDEDFDPGYPGDDHQPAQSPPAGGSVESSLLKQLPTTNVPSPTKPRTTKTMSWVAAAATPTNREVSFGSVFLSSPLSTELVEVPEIPRSEQAQQGHSRRRTQATKQTVPKKQRRRKKKRDRAKRPFQMTAVITPKAQHPHGRVGLICVSTLEPQLVDEMPTHSALVHRLPDNVNVPANSRIDSDPDGMGSSAESTLDVDDATYDGPTDAGFQAINEAHAQPALSTSPEPCFLLAL